jgi:hypothetical protein
LTLPAPALLTEKMRAGRPRSPGKGRPSTFFDIFDHGKWREVVAKEMDKWYNGREGGPYRQFLGAKTACKATKPHAKQLDQHGYLHLAWSDQNESPE